MIVFNMFFLFFFFKQKTAYELRISDWSSDVCSSDLQMFGDIEFGLALVDRHSERARFSDRAIVMGRREDDPIDARRQRVEVEREAGPVRGRCEADFAV